MLHSTGKYIYFLIPVNGSPFVFAIPWILNDVNYDEDKDDDSHHEKGDDDDDEAENFKKNTTSII